MFGDKDEREKEILVLCQLSKTKPQTNLAKTYNPSVIKQRTYSQIISQNIQKPSKQSIVQIKATYAQSCAVKKQLMDDNYICYNKVFNQGLRHVCSRCIRLWES